MQVSGDIPLAYIGSYKGDAKGNAFYTVSLCDGTQGDTFKFYTTADVYATVKKLTFGAPVSPVFNVFQGRNGVGVRLIDIIT